jgi:hypothetical protein
MTRFTAAELESLEVLRERFAQRAYLDLPAPSAFCQCVDCKCDSLRTISYPVVCRECRLGSHAVRPLGRRHLA